MIRLLSKNYKTSIKKLNNKNGAITIFLLLIFIGIFALTALLVEGARIRSANATLKRGVDSSIRSTLAGFDRELKETYGIFTFKSSLAEENTKKYLESNLDYRQEGSWDPYNFKIENFKLEAKHSLMDTEILERQILEYMKYRGIVSVGEEVYEKLEAFFAIGKTAPLLKREQKIDKEINNIGKTIRALKMSIDKHNLFNDTELENIKNTIKEAIVLKKDLHETKEELKELGEEYESIYYSSGEETSNNQELKRLEEEIRETKKTFNSIQDDLDKLNTNTIKKTLRQEIHWLENINTSIGYLIKESKNVENLINTADKKMDKSDNILSGFRDASKEKHKDYRDIISGAKLQNIKKEILANKIALDNLQKLYNKPPFNITEASAKSTINNMFKEYKEEINYEIPKGNGKTTIMVDMDKVDESSKASLNELKKLFTGIKNIIGKLFVEEKKYTGSLASEIEESDYILPSNEVKKQDTSFTLMGYKASDISGHNSEPPDFDKAEKDAENAVNGLASAFEDADTNLYKKEIIDSVFSRHGPSGLAYEFRDTLLVNEYIMLMFNNRTTQYNGKAFFKECEVEYIIYGSLDHQTNANLAYGEISAHRLVTNLLSLYSCAPKTMGLVRKLATAMASWSGGLTYLGWEIIVAGIYSGIEAGIDTYELTQGNKIAFIKEDKHFLLGGKDKISEIIRKFVDVENPTGANIFKSDERVKGIVDKNKDKDIRLNLSKSESDIEVKKATIESGKTKKTLPVIEVDYEDYLRFILVGRELVGQKEKLIGRIQNLFHINMNEIEKGFDLNEMFTYLYVNVDASIKSMFFKGKGIEGADGHMGERRTINSKIMYGY